MHILAVKAICWRCVSRIQPATAPKNRPTTHQPQDLQHAGAHGGETLMYSSNSVSTASLNVGSAAFCFVYDLVRESLIATSQLMLYSNTEELKDGAKPVIDFLEWITPNDKIQYLVRGSMVSRTLYIHQFLVKTSHASAQVDLQLVARGSLPLL